jgi:hypothetical protein
MNTFDKISDVLNVESEVESSEIVASEKPKLVKVEEPQKDYEYTRGQLYALIEKGQEAVDGILEVATSSDHPRAYEVAGQLIKNVADVADKLMDLQKKMKDLDEKHARPTTVNNSLFVGSTAELSKLIKQGILNNNNQD